VAEPTRTRPALGRRRRRLYWTIVILVAAGLLGAGVGVTLHRKSRPREYRTGEEHAEITRTLARQLPPDAPEPVFREVAEQAGLATFRAFSGARTSQLPEDMGPGAAWGDYDQDGDDDLLLVSAGGPLEAREEERAPSLLYENLGDGTFRQASGFPEPRLIGMGAAWGDYDGDGWLDLAVTGYNALRLYRNRDGRFTRDPAIPDREGFWAGASWADYDQDGDLDLYVCGYVQYEPDVSRLAKTSMQYGHEVPFTLNPASFTPERNLLFRNLGRGRFEEVAERMGVANPEGRSLSALWHDFDDDGWPDLYVANDISDNVLYRNRAGKFEDLSHPAWVADYRGAMGLAAGDWNRDGDDDLFISHWIAQENALYDSLVKDLSQGLKFMDVADRRGLGQIALQLVGWGAEFADFDADGWLDLAVANGSTFETEGEPRELRPQPSFLFWNQRGEYFHDLAPLNPQLSAPRVSRGLAVSDYDGDSDVDLLIVDRDGPPRLLRNDMPQGHWIELRLKRDGRRPGVVEGTRVVATVDGIELRRAVTSASYLSQSSRTVHLGLGSATRAETIEVRWPGGGSDLYRDVAANEIWELTEGDPAPRGVARSAPATPPTRAQVLEFWNKQRAAMNAMKVDGDPGAAVALFREALALDPEHEDSLYYLGNCLAETGDVEGALAEFETLMRLNPMSHRAHKRWATLRATSARSPADLEAAARALERAVEINKEETGALLVLAEVDVMRGELDSARKRLEWVVRTNPKSGEGWFVLAYLAWKGNDPRRSRDHLERALQARAEAPKPKGGTAEGDVRRRMHADATLFTEFFATWDGSPDPWRAFSGLDARVSASPGILRSRERASGA
jgi:Flp pilus assembly protein TadD